MSVHSTLVFLVVEAESVGRLGIINRPVLVDKEFEEKRGLLANVAVEVLVHLYDHGLGKILTSFWEIPKKSGQILS